MSEPTNAQILEEIAAAIEHSKPSPDLEEALRAIYDRAADHITQLKLELISSAALFVDDVQVEHADMLKPTLFRVAANALVETAAFVVRAAKRTEGADLAAAKFALVAFSIADAVARQPHSDHVVLEAEPGQLRKALEDSITEVMQEKQAVLDDLNAKCAELHRRLAQRDTRITQLEEALRTVRMYFSDDHHGCKTIAAALAEG